MGILFSLLSPTPEPTPVRSPDTDQLAQVDRESLELKQNAKLAAVEATWEAAEQNKAAEQTLRGELGCEVASQAAVVAAALYPEDDRPPPQVSDPMIKLFYITSKSLPSQILRCVIDAPWANSSWKPAKRETLMD